VGNIKNIWDLDINKSFWLVSDKAWMKERKTQWNECKPNIEALLVKGQGMPREYIKYLKTYFLTGEIPDLIAYIDLFVLAWLHPSESIDDWKTLKLSANDLTEKTALRNFYTPALRVLKVIPGRNRAAPKRKYGVLGSRYYPIYNFLLNDNSGKWDRHEDIVKLKQYHLNEPLSNHIAYCLRTHPPQLNHNDIGFNFLDEWHKRVKNEGIGKETTEALKNLFNTALRYANYAERPNFDDPDAMSEKMMDVDLTICNAILYPAPGLGSPLQEGFANKLLEIIESGDYGDDVNKLWEECKANYIDWLTHYENFIES